MSDICIRVTRHNRPTAGYPVLIEALTEQGRRWFSDHGYPASGIACGHSVADEVVAQIKLDNLTIEEN